MPTNQSTDSINTQGISPAPWEEAIANPGNTHGTSQGNAQGTTTQRSPNEANNNLKPASHHGHETPPTQVLGISNAKSQSTPSPIDEPPSKRTRSKYKQTTITTPGAHSPRQNTYQNNLPLPTQ
eukprot:1152752-Pelagomonas_calceolata.AAC.2